MEETPLLESCTFNFSQDRNCLSDKDEAEFLEIRVEASLGLDRDVKNEFFILKTEGWSLNGIEDLEKLFDRIRKTLKNGDISK